MLFRTVVFRFREYWQTFCPHRKSKPKLEYKICFGIPLSETTFLQREFLFLQNVIHYQQLQSFLPSESFMIIHFYWSNYQMYTLPLKDYVALDWSNLSEKRRNRFFIKCIWVERCFKSRIQWSKLVCLEIAWFSFYAAN